jgi:EmrB/QacA subfamily drug resistance transporter
MNKIAILNNRWVFFVAAMPGILLTLMDEFGIHQAIPVITDNFNATIPESQWIALGYLLSTGALLMPAGRLADRIGYKRLYFYGLLVFVFGALLSGFAPSLLTLILFKVLQGVAAAMIQATTIPIIISKFTNDRGKALGAFGFLMALSAIFGPVIGGGIVTLLSWRAFMFLSVPLGLISIVLAWFVLNIFDRDSTSVDEIKDKFDWVGVMLSTGSLLLLLLTLSKANDFGWGSYFTIGGFIITGVLLVSFIIWELKFEFPLLPLHLFLNGTFLTGQIGMFLVVLGNSCIFFLLPFYIQDLKGYEAFISGLVIAGLPLGFLVTGPTIGVLSDRYPSGWKIFLPFGLTISAISMLLLSILSTDSSIWLAFIYCFMMGFGIGFIFMPAQNAIYGIINQKDQGVVTGFINMVRNSSTLTSIAVGTAIVTSVMASQGYPASLDAVREGTIAGIYNSFLEGMTTTFLIGFFVIALGVLLTVVSYVLGRRSKPINRQIV